MSIGRFQEVALVIDVPWFGAGLERSYQDEIHLHECLIWL